MDVLLPIALQYLSVPYIYGSKNPLIGLDCSGLTRLLLLAGGVHVPPEVENAQQQHDYFSQLPNHTDQKIRLGTLLFYGLNGRIEHVTMALDGFRQIESGHGNSQIKSVQDAVNAGAYVRISSIRFNSNFDSCFFPDFPDYKAP